MILYKRFGAACVCMNIWIVYHGQQKSRKVSGVRELFEAF